MKLTGQISNKGVDLEPVDVGVDSFFAKLVDFVAAQFKQVCCGLDDHNNSVIRNSASLVSGTFALGLIEPFARNALPGPLLF